MSHPIWGTLYQHTIFGEQDGQAVLMVNHWAFLDAGEFAGETAEVADVNGVLNVEYAQHVLPLQLDVFGVNSYKTEAIGSFDVITDPANPTETILEKHEVASTEVGGITPSTDPMPTFNAVSVRKLTTRQGTQIRGGCRLCCLEEADVVHNTLIQAKIDAVQAGMGAYFTPTSVTTSLGTQLLYPMVFSRKVLLEEAGNPANPGSDSSAEITGVFTSKFVSSQVSRKRRRRLG